MITITCSIVMLQCYRRQAIAMEQAKIWPSVTLYSLDQSLPNLEWLITSSTPTQMTNISCYLWLPKARTYRPRTFKWSTLVHAYINFNSSRSAV